MSFKGDVIEWLFPLVVDRKAKTAYMIGWGGQRALVLTIEYTKTPSPITLCYTDELPDFGSGIPVIDEGGNLIVTGGINHEHDNFDPLKTVWRLRVGRTTQTGLLGSGYLPIAVLVILLIGACAGIFIVRRKPADEADKTQDTTADDDQKEQQPLSSKQQNSRELMERIRKVVESEKLYLNSELKMSDVAAMLHTNSTYISESINTQKKCSFSQFINSYRVEYAKRLIRSNPDAKLSTLCIEAGFSNETSFFRTFKAMTGMTPNEWRKTNEQP
jgi:AraC-like DNA-binding protein